MITDVEYMQIVSEAYDLSDYKTKKRILFCNEAEKTSNVEHIVGKLYQHIKNDSTGIDFGTIPKSKGIVTNIENFAQLTDCVTVIHDLVVEYHENTKIIDEVSTAIANVQNRERLFTKAFALNIELPIMLYNTTMLSVFSATSLIITSSIEYIKNGHDSFKESFDKSGYYDTKNNLMYDYICQFNRNCSNGSIDKLINECIKNNATSTNESAVENINEEDINFAKEGLKAARDLWEKSPTILKVIEAVIGIGIAAFGIIKGTRAIIYLFLRTKLKFSDWCDAQANFLQLHADNLKNGSDKDKKAYQRQMKWVTTLRKIANKLAVSYSKAEKDEKDNERNNKDEYNEPNNNDGSENGDNDDGGIF